VTKEEARKQLQDAAIKYSDDPERAENVGLKVIFEFLETQGHSDLVELYGELPSWYQINLNERNKE